MAFILHKHKVVYHAIPKCACTSLKHVFYEELYGKQFQSPAGDPDKIHELTDEITSKVMDAKDWRDMKDYVHILVVRDPLNRLMSAYSNRVCYYGELNSGEYDSVDGTPIYPNFNDFISEIETIKKYSPSIGWHTKLQKDFIGGKIGRYTIFKLEEMNKLEEYLSGVFGRQVKVPRLQDGGVKMSFRHQTSLAQRLALEYCEPDYHFLSNYYEMPSLSAEIIEASYA